MDIERIILLKIFFQMTENEISAVIVSKAIEVHRVLGPGMLERAYQNCLYKELIRSGIPCRKEVHLPLMYKGEEAGCDFRMDLLVNEKVIVEIKSASAIADVHLAQLLTYLRISELKLGLVINFNEVLLKNGVRRVVNGL